MDRKICLIDADTFFVAVVRNLDPVRAAQSPDVLVGGSGARSVVASASASARKRGVQAGMPMQQAQRLCPNAWVTGVPREALRAAHQQILFVIHEWAPIVEAASVDEWYADFTGTESLYSLPLSDVAARMRRDIMAKTGYSVSVGGGTSRFIAKVASDAAKPGHGGTGVRIVLPGEEPEFLKARQISDFPGVGPVLTERLQRLSLYKVTQLQALDQATLEAWLGSTTGRWLWERAWGRDDSPVGESAATKSHSRETTLETDVRDSGALLKILGGLIVPAAESMRSEGLACRTVEVKLRTPRFETFRAASTMLDAVTADKPLYRSAVATWKRLRQMHPGPVRLVGVRLTGLIPQNERPLVLIETADTTESPKDALIAALGDSLRHRFGPRALRPAWSSEDD